MKPDVDRLLQKHGKLTARKIAKQLGCTRKEVNSFLYANPQDYTKNVENDWALAGAAELKLQLPAGWTTATSFEQALNHAYSGRDPATFLIIFEEDCKLKFDCIARILAVANHAARQNAKVVLDFSASTATKNYLNRAAFFDRLATDVVVLPERPRTSAAQLYQGRSDTLLEIGEIRVGEDNSELVDGLCDKFVLYSRDEYETAALTMFGELVTNVVEHSKAMRGFAGFQKYGGPRPHIQAVVSDDGEGIATTLRPALAAYRPGLLETYGKASADSDMSLVVHAVCNGGVSRTKQAGRGLGLKVTCDQTKQFNAAITVRQQGFAITFKYRDGILTPVKRTKQLMPVRGTHISFDLFLA